MSNQTSGMLFSYVNRSQYHESCVPKNVTQTVEPADAGKAQKSLDRVNFDPVSQDVIWRQTLQAERRCLKDWEENWGFLTAYDAKGRVRERQPLPERSNMFSNDVPNTSSGNYGNRLTTDLGSTMSTLEKRFFSQHRKRHLPSEMLCL
ncbi:unnamed protein product [Candidula unifasciata]|uniref:Uncharacterized protein n=1 Tax=Candidula unifasciata TaxID=100452 RepID=A0A8S3YVA2_9EUPU|nr:unnamed protein product [Candidula unifasciata]